jgi:hypothetical protein
VGSAATALSSRITSASTPVASPVAADGALGTCGIKYDLGAELARGEFTRPATHEEYYRDELTAIRDQLHCELVDLYGSDVDQLTAGLDIAADLGFDIHLQTRLNFLPETDMTERLAAVAIEAERVRREGIPIVLDVGCEYLLFADGLIEGNDFFEKTEAITSGNLDWDDILQRFGALLHTLADTARANFGGLITYSDTPDMDFAWEPFDIIGIDHYLSSESRATYVKTIDDLAATGKPVWVKEFGSTPGRGAPEGGGMAWDIIDYSVSPPQIVDGIVRDEEEQARVIIETLEHIDRSQAKRAYLYEFITTGSTRSNDPRFDYDLTGYGIVSTWGSDHDHSYDATGFWEPKVAFDQLAAWNLARREART